MWRIGYALSAGFIWTGVDVDGERLPMSSRTEQFDQAFQALVTDVASTLAMESALGGKGPLKIPKARGKHKNASFSHVSLSTEPRDPVEIAEVVLKECKRKRRAMEDGTTHRVTDEELFNMARFTDKFKLRSYERFLHYVPRIVNVVTVCSPPTLQASIPSPLLPHLCVRSSPRPSLFPGVGPLCRSTSTGSQPAAATPTTHPRSSARCSWPTRSRGAVYWSSVSHCHQIEPVYLLT